MPSLCSANTTGRSPRSGSLSTRDHRVCSSLMACSYLSRQILILSSRNSIYSAFAMRLRLGPERRIPPKAPFPPPTLALKAPDRPANAIPERFSSQDRTRPHRWRYIILRAVSDFICRRRRLSQEHTKRCHCVGGEIGFPASRLRRGRFRVWNVRLRRGAAPRLLHLPLRGPEGGRGHPALRRHLRP